MACSSCQSNHTTTVVTLGTTTTPCDCACGCSEPVCPTPQPCTEITDSKCIIYTDAEIKCGNDIVVPVNTSVSTAMNNIIAYFCGLQGALPTYKYVQEQVSGFDGDTIRVLRSSLVACGLIPSACDGNSGLADAMCDLHVNVYYLNGTDWVLIGPKPIATATENGYHLIIDSTTGDMTIVLDIPPITPSVTVRVVVLA